MSLPLPDLDNRRFDDLVAEMRTLIPLVAPEWTNHNVSDPGIALIELLAWIAEVSLYRANRIPSETIANFVSLLLGESSVPSSALKSAMNVTTADIEREARSVSPDVDQVHVRYSDPDTLVAVMIVVRAGAAHAADVIAAVDKRLRELWVSGPQIIVESLEGAKQRALRSFNYPYRAITTADFAREAILASPGVGRVRVVVDPLYGTITVAIAPASGWDPTPELLADVKNRISERKLVGTCIVVRAPVYTDIALAIRLVARPNTVVADVKSAATAAVTNFFDPRSGGSDGDGWPFGRPVSLYELYRLAESLPGVDHVEEIKVNGNPEIQEMPIRDLPRLANLTVDAEA